MLYLINILEYIGKIWKYTEAVNDIDELFKLNEQMNLNASLNLLANIGENVSKITDGLKQEYPSIEWQRIKDFRNKIVHNYIGIDLDTIYEIIINDLKVLKQEIENIIKEKIIQKVFDTEAIKISKESQFYRHIDFDKITHLI